MSTSDLVSEPARDRAESLAGVGTWRLDLRTGVLETNAAARDLLGWTRTDRDPDLAEFLACVHPDDAARVAAAADRLATRGEEYVVEHRVRVLSGREVHLRSSASAECDDDGRPVRLHGVSLDVTDLVEAAAAARRDQDRSRAVLDSLHEGYLLSRDGVVVEVNQALCALTGFSAAELVGSSAPYVFWAPEETERVLQLREELRRAGAGSVEIGAVRRDGTTMRLAVTGTVLASDGGAPLWSLALRDVTQERLRERRLEEQAATDPLTGVSNSRAFRRSLQAAVADPGARPLSLALVDIDHFKTVNDRFGHSVGDEVLVAFVARLVEAVEDVGTVARVGGEEFAVLLTGLDGPQAQQALRRALGDVRSTSLPPVGTITASAGVAELLDGMDDDHLYRLADAMLYEAKARGRDQVR